MTAKPEEKDHNQQLKSHLTDGERLRGKRKQQQGKKEKEKERKKQKIETRQMKQRKCHIMREGKKLSGEPDTKGQCLKGS